MHRKSVHFVSESRTWKSFVASVVGGADGGVSSDICGMVSEPVVQTLADRRTHKMKLVVETAAVVVAGLTTFSILPVNSQNVYAMRHDVGFRAMCDITLS